MEGYDAKFDPPLEKRLECPICLLAQREPVQTPCGHRFCFSCILRALRETGPKCPVDNIKISQSQLFKDNFAKREVLSLSVKCSAEESGCSWKGELRDFEIHSKNCEMVTVECPYSCLSTFQRKHLAEHLLVCQNKPSQCPFCAVSFPGDKITEHEPFCSHTRIPDSLMKEITKNNEILKWCGQLRLKLNGQSMQICGYLTAKAESEESFVFTGKWFTGIHVMPLTSTSAKVFWKTLNHREVKPYFFNFSLLSTDAKSSAFQRMLRKKSDAINAVIGLRLKSSSHRCLTVIYFYWNDQKKCLSACVAELESYLVKQIQNRLQILQQSNRMNRDTTGVIPVRDSHSVRLMQPAQHHSVESLRANVPNEPAIRIMGIQPQPNTNCPTIVSNILSWQISQSFPTFPWRMHAASAGVPFFTIPATPPQFLPAHSYPYTFAPMPGAPFSISALSNPIAVPSYTTIPVAPPSQITSLDAAIALSGASTHPVTSHEGGSHVSLAPLHSNSNALIGIIQQQLQPENGGMPSGDHLGEPAAGRVLHSGLDGSQYLRERAPTLHRFVPTSNAFHSPESLRLSHVAREGSFISNLNANSSESLMTLATDSVESWGIPVPGPSGGQQFRPPSESDTLSQSSSPLYSVSPERSIIDSIPDSPSPNLDLSGTTTGSDHSNTSALQTLANAAAILADSASESSFEPLSANSNSMIPVLVHTADADIGSHLADHANPSFLGSSLGPSGTSDSSPDVVLIPVIQQISNSDALSGYGDTNEHMQHLATPLMHQELQHASGLVLNADPSILAQPATTRGIPVVHWPIDGINGAAGRLYNTNPPLPHEQGNFWDTVMPSLDANLQSTNHSQAFRRHS